MATITYRKLNANNEPAIGQGQANFLSDIDAVAQAIYTSLLLFQGEWWENLLDGLALWQKILGVAGAGKNQQAINLLIQTRILSVPYVVSISSVQSSYNASTRQYNYYAVVQTQFGPVAVQSAAPQPTNRFYNNPPINPPAVGIE